MLQDDPRVQIDSRKRDPKGNCHLLAMIGSLGLVLLKVEKRKARCFDLLGEMGVDWIVFFDIHPRKQNQKLIHMPFYNYFPSLLWIF